MKRRALISVLLALLTVLFLASCAKDPLTAGKTDGNTYENPAIPMTFTAPEGWELLDREAVAALVGDENLGPCEFMAQPSDGSTVGVTLSIHEDGEYADVSSAEDYLNTLREDMENISQSLVVYQFGKLGKITLGEVEFAFLPYTMKFADTDYELSQCRYIAQLRKSGVLVSVSATFGDDFTEEDLSKLFS